jgi:hypothetical protein
MSLQGLQNAGKFLSGCTTGGFSSKAQFQEVSVWMIMNNEREKIRKEMVVGVNSVLGLLCL